MQNSGTLLHEVTLKISTYQLSIQYSDESVQVKDRKISTVHSPENVQLSLHSMKRNVGLGPKT